MNISKLQELVAKSGFSKVQIAEKCGFTRVTLDNALSGADVKISTVEALANVLGVSASVFFGGCDEVVNPSAELITSYKREIEHLQSLLNKKSTAKVVVELDVDADEFIKLGLKDKVVQVLNKK